MTSRQNLNQITQSMLGAGLRKSRQLHGGDLTDVQALSLIDGREVVLKTGGHVGIEANMLRVLAEAGAPVPQILANNAEVLFLQYLPEGGETAAGWASLGRALRALHDQHGPQYGWSSNYAFGPLRIHNQPFDDWPTFWAENRLMPHLRHLPDTLSARVTALCQALPDLLPARPAASLLHGDLWTGNVLFSDQRAYFIDPACYYGDAEVDLAMLSLFASPDSAFYDAYGPCAPNIGASADASEDASEDAGADRRLAIYQLWPALVHLRLFGDSYQSLVTRCLNAAGV